MSQLDTYDSGADAETDRTQQKSLLAALGAWDRALRRDECGAWCINGKHGRVYTWGDGKTWELYVACQSSRGWTSAKTRLAFCEVTQDAAWEGCLRLHALPTTDQAEIIRDIFGIRKRVELTPEELERRRSQAAAWHALKPPLNDRLQLQEGQRTVGGTLTHPPEEPAVFDRALRPNQSLPLDPAQMAEI